MDENSEEGRVLAHCESLPTPDPTPRGPSRIPGTNPGALSSPSPRSREGKLTFIEHLILTGHFPGMMSCNHHSNPSGRYYCQSHFTRREAEIQKKTKNLPKVINAGSQRVGSPTWVGLQCPTLPPQVPFSLGSGCSETVGCCFSPFPTRWGPSLYLSLQPGMGAQPRLSGRGLLTHRARPQPAGGGSHRGQPGLARAPCARGAWPTPSAETRGPFRAPGPAPKPPPGSSPQRGHAGKLGVDPAQLPKASLFPCPPPSTWADAPLLPPPLLLSCLPAPSQDPGHWLPHPPLTPFHNSFSDHSV